MVLALRTTVTELNRGCAILRTDQAVALKFFPVTPVCHIYRLRDECLTLPQVEGVQIFILLPHHD